jgi:tetratricopeptide (TPR) repeat protein
VSFACAQSCTAQARARRGGDTASSTVNAPWRPKVSALKKRSFSTSGKLFTFLVAGLALLCPLAFGIDDLGGLRNDAQRHDMELAEQALKARDVGDAEMYFERYLRKNPDGFYRWGVWEKLLDISLNVRQDRFNARDYLEIMLLEYAHDGPKRREIQFRLADLCADMRQYARAGALWEKLLADSELTMPERATVYRKLSALYLRRLEITNATEMLDQCLRLDIPALTKGDCLYELAETQMLTEDLKASEQSLNTLLCMTEISSERRVAGTFMLADVMEQQSRYDEARRYYESIRTSYPNAKVVEMRLTSLKNRKHNRKAPDVVSKK